MFCSTPLAVLSYGTGALTGAYFSPVPVSSRADHASVLIALVSSSHKSAGHDWQVTWRGPARWDPESRKWLHSLFERVPRTVSRRGRPHLVFLDVAKVFDTIWVYSMVYKLTPLNFPSCFVKIISFNLRDRTFEVSFQVATSTCRGMRNGVAEGGLVSPFLCSFYVKGYSCSFPPRTVSCLRRLHGHHRRVSHASAPR
jgi:hypothetical protein